MFVFGSEWKTFMSIHEVARHHMAIYFHIQIDDFLMMTVIDISYDNIIPKILLLCWETDRSIRWNDHYRYQYDWD